MSNRLIRQRSAHFPADLATLGQKLTVGLEVSAVRHEDPGALKALQSVHEHRAVLLSENVASDLDDQIQPLAQELSLRSA